MERFASAGRRALCQGPEWIPVDPAAGDAALQARLPSVCRVCGRSRRPSRPAWQTRGGVRSALPDTAAPATGVPPAWVSARRTPREEFIASRVLSLPMYPGISTEAIEYVAAEMQEICD